MCGATQRGRGSASLGFSAAMPSGFSEFQACSGRPGFSAATGSGVSGDASPDGGGGGGGTLGLTTDFRAMFGPWSRNDATGLASTGDAVDSKNFPASDALPVEEMLGDRSLSVMDEVSLLAKKSSDPDP